MQSYHDDEGRVGMTEVDHDKLEDSDDYELTTLLPPSERSSSPESSKRTLPHPFRRAAHIVRCRPLLTAFAFLTGLITLGVVLISNSDHTVEEYLSWFNDAQLANATEPELMWEVEDPTKLHRLKTMDTLNGECLEAWVARGALCTPLEGLIWMRQSMSQMELDAVWTWVNGSDPRHELSSQFWTKQGVNASIYDIQPPSDDVAPLNPHARPLLADPQVLESIQQADNETRAQAQALARRDTLSDPLANKKNNKWFRDHDELKFSMRSVGMHLEGLRTMHVLAADFQSPFQPPDNTSIVDYNEVGFMDYLKTPDDLTGNGRREGQWPQWIDPTHFFDEEGNEKEDVAVRIQHHWNLFTLPDDAGENQTNWKNRVLPSFNSYAIETQIMNLDDLGEIFIYNNDDFFLNRDLARSDFYSPLYGPVFRIRPNSGVNSVENDTSDFTGELTQIHRSAWVLSQRFGERRRPYIEHATKSYTLPLLKETRMMFPGEFARTSEHRFRGLGQDVVAIFLANHLQVERHREALLWSFLVARGDRDGDGWLGWAELRELADFFTQGSVSLQRTSMKVNELRRTTLAGMSPILEAVGMKKPQQSTITYTSQDGYPYYRPAGEKLGWPHVYTKYGSRNLCTIDVAQCLPEYFDEEHEGLSADELMKRFAFERQECGDCLIMQLTSLSGPRGMSAFLPNNDSYFPSPNAATSLSKSLLNIFTSSTSSPPSAPTLNALQLAARALNLTHDATHLGNGTDAIPQFSTVQPPVAHLPIGDTWQPLNYSLSAIQELTGWPADRSRREFAMRLIQRYSYVTAVSPFYFAMLKKPRQALNDLKRITTKKPALVCINDDIIDGRDQIDAEFELWLQKQFPKSLPFERPT